MNRKLQKFQETIGVFYVPLVMVLLSIIVLVFGYQSVQPEQYNFSLNQVAEETIQAPVTVEDEYLTEQAREYARDSVDNVFIYQPSIRETQLQTVQDFFSWLSSIKQGNYSTNDLITMVEEHGLGSLLEESIETERDNNESVSFSELNGQEQYIVFQANLDETTDAVNELVNGMTDETIQVLLSADQETIQTLQSELTDILSTTLEAQINAGQLDTVQDEVNQTIEDELDNTSIQNTLVNMAETLIVPTVVFDEEQTERRKQEAADSVQPSYILQGQVVVQEGHVINEEDMRQLELLGFLNQSSGSYNAIVFYILIVIHGVLLSYIFTKRFKFDEIDQSKLNLEATAYGIVFGVSFIMMTLFNSLEVNGISYAMLLFPIFAVPQFLVPQIGYTKTVIGIVFFNLFTLFSVSHLDNLTNVIIISLFYFFSALISIIMMKQFGDSDSHQKHRQKRMIQAVGWHLIVAIPLMLTFNIAVVSEQFLLMITMVVVNVLFSYLIVFLVHPYWDQLLNNRATLTLNQLSNLNHPLLKELITNAPGSYHHSILVANLSANAVEAIDGDSLLTRVASYYHDVGKSSHPLFFTENVSGGIESPHSVITPEESASIIIDHVSQGEKLLNEYNFPQSIIDICLQHHGTTLVRYFYHQAKEENGENKVDEFLYRYPGPKPQTKEAAVIMIADSVEAASRSLKDYSQVTIENLIDSIISDKTRQNQFSDCDLTVHELKVVRKSLIHGVASMYHTRVEYPE